MNLKQSDENLTSQQRSVVAYAFFSEQMEMFDVILDICVDACHDLVMISSWYLRCGMRESGIISGQGLPGLQSS